MIGEKAPVSVPDSVLAALPTPSLLVDLAAADRNIEVLAKYFRGSTRAQLRPHFKAHKCTELMRRQLAAGGCVGVTCATAQEALVLAEAGFSDILLANELADEQNLDTIGRAAKRAKITIAVDHHEQVRWLDVIARRHDVRFRVLIDIDAGMHRTGLSPDDPAVLELAAAVKESAVLELVGIFAYEGHAQMQSPRERRAELVRDASAATGRARDALIAAGFPVSIVSGGGSGTYDLSTEAGVLNEIQAGSYVLMDSTYGKVGLPFEPALFCIATVISTPTPTTAVVNAGLKAMSFEKGPPSPALPGMRITKLSDEHGSIVLDEGTKLSVGDRVPIIPSHIDPTINLHDKLFVWDAKNGVTSWRVDGRRQNT
jgi:D-serine deaminase-like pyridoxal phosphate-dependent protein